MLNHDFYYPEIPSKPEYPGISRRRDHWQRQAIALWLVSEGYSLAVEIQKLISVLFFVNHRSGALRQALSGLRTNGLMVDDALTLRVFAGRRTKITVVRLSDTGRDLVQSLGWTVNETEWERMQRLHEKGNDQPRHTAAVLAFVYQARLRGWSAGVMPELDAGRFVPDVLVEKNGESYYVEVELGEQKASKWHNMARHQGVIALCGRTPEHRGQLLAEAEVAARKHQCNRLGTDLRTLFEQSESPLWIDEI